MEPTITDANLVLGRLNPVSLLRGDMRIFPRLARLALKRLGDGLRMGVEEAAAGVVRIADSMMSKILRIVSVERGFDPRRFALVAFGGAGPMHACPLAEELQISDIFIPPNPGMFSALGLLTADLFHDYSRAFVRRVDEADPDTVKGFFAEMEYEGRETLLAEGVDSGGMRFRRQLDLRYLGQSYELTVDVGAPFDGDALSSCIEAFHGRHREIYGYSAAGEPVEMVNVRLRAIGAIPKPRLAESGARAEAAEPVGRRLVYFEGSDSWLETPVYERGDLGPGSAVEGPSIVEQYDSTTVIYPGWGASVDGFGVLRLRRDAR